MITAQMNKAISKGVLQTYKQTITQKLPGTIGMVDLLQSSDITSIFYKLNDESTESALSMGFSLKQIVTIPSKLLSDYKYQFDAYNIPLDIQNQIVYLLRNDILNLSYKDLTTGHFIPIIYQISAFTAS